MDMVYEKSTRCFFVRYVTHPLNPPPVRGTYYFALRNLLRILVMMDMVYTKIVSYGRNRQVVILVIMDMVYTVMMTIVKFVKSCNPCYNGYGVHHCSVVIW